MRGTKHICVNWGKCHLADTRRRLRPGGPEPRCPICHELLIRAPVHWPWLAVLVIGIAAATAVFAGVKVGLRRSSQRMAAGSARASAAFRLPPSDVFTDAETAQLTGAALRGDERGMDAALARGAAIEASGRDGLTPLLVTLLNFDPAAFAALLRRGANPNRAAANGESAITVAAIMPDRAYLEAVLRHGGHPDTRDARQRTPLILAIQRRRADNVRLLLESHADVNASDSRGDTPLMHAFQGLTPDASIIRALLERGARSDIPNPAGFTAMDYAATFRDPALLALLSR